MSFCEGCGNKTSDYQKQQVINKAKEDAKKTGKQFIIYSEGGQWFYIDRELAAGIPVTMVISQFTP